ncbi:MAG TPA: succinyldiaminopimelate transaminase [Steroidobacteraceae bacterium]
MNPRLASLHPYPFERLRRLISGIQPPSDLSPIALWIGEPRHAPPQFLIDALTSALGTLGQYPAALGLPELRAAASNWLVRRFGLPAASVDPQTMLLPVSGTREALFSFVQAVIDPADRPLVVMPNPFYQIYEGAALLAGAEPYYLDALAGNRYLPDLQAVPDSAWRRCQLLFLCSPGNPTGAVMSPAYLAEALDIAERFGFVIAADECYADIYLDEAAPPSSLLQAALAAGRSRFERCVVFHSLSKRSSAPGLRSGFVAGDPAILQQYLLYRTYHGAAVGTHVQMASTTAWNDDAHAAANRALYRQKFDQVIPVLEPVLDVSRPDGAFYLWPHIGDDDEAFVHELYARKNVLVLPGSYMARETGGTNPGRGRVRLSLVASVPDCVMAAHRIRDYMERR